MIEVHDLRGLALDDQRRKDAYPRETFEFGQPMQYLHLESTRWFYDASDPAHKDEADRAIAAICFRAETRAANDRAPGYRPFRVVVDNYGGTIVGQYVN